jgi:type I restriction enzyme M protein
VSYRASASGIESVLIRDRLIDVMVAVSSNFFYMVTLPVTLWFLDRARRVTRC